MGNKRLEGLAKVGGVMFSNEKGSQAFSAVVFSAGSFLSSGDKIDRDVDSVFIMVSLFTHSSTKCGDGHIEK